MTLNQFQERYLSQPPQYRHECANCIFLGRYKDFDLHACGMDGELITVIARYSNEPEDYHSGVVFSMTIHEHPLREALRRVCFLGVLNLGTEFAAAAARQCRQELIAELERVEAT
jgi:hypothetical protein